MILRQNSFFYITGSTKVHDRGFLLLLRDMEPLMRNVPYFVIIVTKDFHFEEDGVDIIFPIFSPKYK